MRKDTSKIPVTTLFLGNGFDLSLGLKTKYIDYFNSKEFWPTHHPIFYDELLCMRLNGMSVQFGKQSCNKDSYTWYDLEDELKQHAKRSCPKGIELSQSYKESAQKDQVYFRQIQDGLLRYLKLEEDRWCNEKYVNAKSSCAYEVVYEICKKTEPNIITFNYTNLHRLIEKCQENISKKEINIQPYNIHHVHGTLREENIILGINEDKDVPQEYDYLFKSWNDSYESHTVIDTLKNSNIIIFFGLSFGSIDSVYFVDFFDSIIKGTFDNNKKHIIICAYNENSIREIYRQFFSMGISIMELKAHCDFNVLFTNPEDEDHPKKFDRGTLGGWLKEWNDITNNIL